MLNENCVDQCIAELQEFCDHLSNLCNVGTDQDGKAAAISCATQSIQIRMDFLKESKEDFAEVGVDGIALCLDNLNSILAVLAADLKHNDEDAGIGSVFSRAFSSQMKKCIRKIKSIKASYDRKWLERIYNT